MMDLVDLDHRNKNPTMKSPPPYVETQVVVQNNLLHAAYEPSPGDKGLKAIQIARLRGQSPIRSGSVNLKP